MKANDIQKMIFNIKKLNKWHLKNKGTIHHNLHIWLKEISHVRLTSYLHPKS